MQSPSLSARWSSTHGITRTAIRSKRLDCLGSLGPICIQNCRNTACYDLSEDGKVIEDARKYGRSPIRVRLLQLTLANADAPAGWIAGASFHPDPGCRTLPAAMGNDRIQSPMVVNSIMSTSSGS